MLCISYDVIVVDSRTDYEDEVSLKGNFSTVISISDRSMNSTVVGPFGVGTPNDNYERLLDFCIGNNLRINGSWFEGNVMCKNLGAIGSGAVEGRRKTSLHDPNKLDFFSV